MRLIDVDLYCATICKCNRRACDRAKCPIHNAPTAYSVDKVVEELEGAMWLTTNDDGETNKLSIQVVSFDDAIEIVKQEAEQCNNGWIPCSERLPEIDGNTSDTVLVCGSNGFLHMAFWCDDLQWRFCECGMAKEPVLWTEIVAWQPLPEPFKERD